MRKKKILIIDDEKDFTEMVKFNLEATGNYEVVCVNKGSDALDTTISCQPDLILLDVIMPDAEGPDIYNKLRNNEYVNYIPVVFLTATIRRDEVDPEEGTVGGHAFLAKPTSIKELIDCIEREIDLATAD